MNAHEIPWWVTLLCTATVTIGIVWTTYKTPPNPQRLDPEAAKTLDRAFRARIHLLSKR